MMREYVFDKVVKDTVKESILKDAKELEGLEKVEITEDGKHVIVGAEEQAYPVVMTNLLNIYCKYSRGNHMSFTRFI